MFNSLIAQTNQIKHHSKKLRQNKSSDFINNNNSKSNIKTKSLNTTDEGDD